MFPAKNNIIVEIKNEQHPGYAILNPIAGSFDLMDPKEHDLFQRIIKGETSDPEFEAALLERGYLYKDKKAHDRAVDRAYDEFNEEIAASQVQLMLVPTYGCNLACTYCYQGRGLETEGGVPDHIDNRPNLITKETVDAFFDYAKTNFSQSAVKPFITLFGGEPLANSPAQRKIISYILDRCAEEGYEFSAVSNGYDFIEYVDLLKKVKVKEIQFTLDGSREIHNGRRATANKKGTFDRIIEGMEAAVENKIPINLRSVVDLENIEDIVHLAEFLDAKGWLDLPVELFKTQIGRNYELFDCYAKPQHLMTQVELWGEYSALSKKYPVLAKFHRPDFKGIRHLVDTGEMYMASFDTCPACKTEWVFDLYGYIYGCTASCGREEYLLGTFWPEVDLNQNAVEAWHGRDVKSIEKCRDCKYDVICGGGCGVVAANANGLDARSPDCRPIQEMLEIGVNHYIDEIAAMSDEEDADEPDDTTGGVSVIGVKTTASGGKKIILHKPSKPAKATPTKTASHAHDDASGSCCSPAPKKKGSGCLICGSDLVYTNDTTAKATCAVCHQEFTTNVTCEHGHYVCDTCHSLDIMGKVEQLLLAADEKDPMALVNRIFELPGLNMHGPEYHAIVPGVLVTAWLNHNGTKDESKIKEALRRGSKVSGGSCGYYGNCGASVGAGTAVSIIEGATPMTKDSRGSANRVTGKALISISEFGGPRCCKRESVTSILSFMETTDYFKGMEPAEYVCKQYGKNKDCIRLGCPYFPVKR